MQTTETFKNTKDIMTYIATLFPKCFAMKGEVRPLKIGIFQDLAQRLEDDEKVTKTQLRSALRYYTSSWHYLDCAKEGAIRVDLDGSDCGELDAEHIEYARVKLRESKERFYERKKEREQQQGKQGKPNQKVKPATAQKVNTRRHTEKPQKPAVKGKSSAQNSKGSVNKTNAPKSHKPVDMTKIQIDQKVNVNMGKGDVAATVLEIKKDDVRVQLNNGLQLVVKPTHLNTL